MTEENKKDNIKVELEKAVKLFMQAELLYKDGFIDGAISRLYYFLLHTVKALLLTKGLEPKSHEAALRIFGLYFVKEGVFAPEASHIFSKLMKYREEADYNPSYIFTPDDFIQFKKEAVGIADKIKDYIESKGYFKK